MTLRITEKLVFGNESQILHQTPIKIVDFEPNQKLPFVDASNLTNLNIKPNITSNNDYVATEVKNANFTIEENKFYIIIADNITMTIPATMSDYSIWGYLNFGNYTTTISIPAGQSIVNRLNATTSIATSLTLKSDKASKEFISYNVSGALTHYSKFNIGRANGLTFSDFANSSLAALKKPFVSPNKDASYVSIQSHHITEILTRPIAYLTDVNNTNTTTNSYLRYSDAFYYVNSSSLASNNTYSLIGPNSDQDGFQMLIPGRIYNFILIPPDSGATNKSGTFTISKGSSSLTFEGLNTISYTGTFVNHAYIRLICDGTSSLKILEASDGWTIS